MLNHFPPEGKEGISGFLYFFPFKLVSLDLSVFLLRPLGASRFMKRKMKVPSEDTGALATKLEISYAVDVIY